MARKPCGASRDMITAEIVFDEQSFEDGADFLIVGCGVEFDSRNNFIAFFESFMHERRYESAYVYMSLY